MFIHRNRATHAPAVSLRGAAGSGQGASTGAAGSFVVRNLSAMQTPHTGSAAPQRDRRAGGCTTNDRSGRRGITFDPPRALSRFPSDHPKKSAAKRGKSHRGAQERTRGICSQLS